MIKLKAFLVGIIVILLLQNIVVGYNVHNVWYKEFDINRDNFAVSDIDNDSFEEIITLSIVFNKGFPIYKLAGDNYYTTLAYISADLPVSQNMYTISEGITISDVDDDKKKEIIIVGGRREDMGHYGSIHIFKSDGNKSRYDNVWQDSKTMKYVGVDVITGDVNNDKKIEILVGSIDGNIYLFRHNEKNNYSYIGLINTSVCRIEEHYIDDKNINVDSCKIFYEEHTIDAAGVSKVLAQMQCENTTCTCTNLGVSPPPSNQREIKGISDKFNATNVLCSCYKKINGTICDNSISKVKISDLNKNGIQEVVAATKKGIFIYEFNGENYIQIWNSTPILNTSRNLVIGDVDNDGEKELITVDTFNNQLYILKNTGKNSYKKVWSSYVAPLTKKALVVGDANKNGINEILIGAYGGIYAFEWNGSNYTPVNSTYSYAEPGLIAMVGGNPSDIEIADTDKDGIMEIIVCTDYRTTMFEVDPEPPKVEEKPSEKPAEPVTPLKPKPDYTKYLITAIILITILLTLFVIWYKKFKK